MTCLRKLFGKAGKIGDTFQGKEITSSTHVMKIDKKTCTSEIFSALRLERSVFLKNFDFFFFRCSYSF